MNVREGSAGGTASSKSHKRLTVAVYSRLFFSDVVRCTTHIPMSDCFFIIFLATLSNSMIHQARPEWNLLSVVYLSTWDDMSVQTFQKESKVTPWLVILHILNQGSEALYEDMKHYPEVATEFVLLVSVKTQLLKAWHLDKFSFFIAVNINW